jgi:1,2-diacylglycerol 3-alpha-glucosyltransferase
VKKLKIALFTDCFTPVVNGVVTATLNLVKGFASRGHEVLLISPDFGPGSIYEHPNVNHIICRGLPALFHADFLATAPLSASLFRTIKAFNPDLIHFQTPWTIGLQAVLIARLLHKPLVGTFHTFFSDPDYLKNVRLNNRYATSAAEKFCLHFYNKCDLVSAPSISTLKVLEIQGLKSPQVYISNGIDGSNFDNTGAAAVKNSYVDEKTILFLYVGRVAPEKNIIFLLQALKQLKADNYPYKMLIVGDGPDYKRAADFIAREGLSDSVLMLGKIPYDKLIRSGIFGAADVFITASKTENQPMTILEAQINGLPVLGLMARGIPDLVVSGINGLLSPIDDQRAFVSNFKKIIDDPGLLMHLKEGCSALIKDHALGNVIDKWETAYESVLKLNRWKKVS